MSPVAKQMTSNTVLSCVTSCKCVFVGFSIQIEPAAVAGSVALFTHCQAVQLSAMTDFVVLNRRTKARIKNCKFFGPNEAK